MKFTNLLLTLGLISLSSSTLQAASSGETLFEAKCAMCHVKVRPDDKSTLVAPPAMGVMRHVKMNYETKESAVAFMVSYILDPKRDKAVCKSKSIQRFGLMPSQKGIVTEAELKVISEWMYDNFTPMGGMNKGKNCMEGKAKRNSDVKISSPFLIGSGLPHMTMLIKQNWDNAELGLSSEQKEKLLVVCKTTVQGIKAVKPKAMKLERKIKELTMSGAATSKILPMVDVLADFKAQLTKVQIQCIYDSKNILTKKQTQFLVN
jgi:hypothetical protein